MNSAAMHALQPDASALDYELPRELIAQRPLERRDGSRLMVVDRASGSVRHGVFTELPELIGPADLLVANDSRVVPARLLARKASGGAVELLALPPAQGTRLVALAKSSKPLRAGQSLVLENGTSVSISAMGVGGRCTLELHSESWDVTLARVGKVPLPPYIRHGQEEAGDRERYQTVYARDPGSIAAPTAGLHFTNEMLERIRRRGARFATVTLHVGAATFAPIRNDVADHVMGSERARLTAGLASEIEETRRRGGALLAIGTTSIRTLESAADRLRPGYVLPFEGETDLFIRPGFEFRVCDRVLTNFHLPRSTLLCLVMAFSGVDLVRYAYEQAVRERYRFYSYGDAMLIV